MDLTLTPIPGYVARLYGLTSGTYRAAPLSEVLRFGKHGTKGHGNRYCVALTDGKVYGLTVSDQPPDVRRAVRKPLAAVPDPPNVRNGPPTLTWGPNLAPAADEVLSKIVRPVFPPSETRLIEIDQPPGGGPPVILSDTPGFPVCPGVVCKCDTGGFCPAHGPAAPNAAWLARRTANLARIRAAHPGGLPMGWGPDEIPPLDANTLAKAGLVRVEKNPDGTYTVTATA